MSVGNATFTFVALTLVKISTLNKIIAVIVTLVSGTVSWLSKLCHYVGSCSHVILPGLHLHTNLSFSTSDNVQAALCSNNKKLSHSTT